MDPGQGTHCPLRWHRLQGLNLRPVVLETTALPVELKRYEKSAPAQVGKDAGGIWLSDAGDDFLNTLCKCGGLFHQTVFLKIFKPL